MEKLLIFLKFIEIFTPIKSILVRRPEKTFKLCCGKQKIFSLSQLVDLKRKYYLFTGLWQTPM